MNNKIKYASVALLVSMMAVIPSCNKELPYRINDDGVPEGYLVEITKSSYIESGEALIDATMQGMVFDSTFEDLLAKSFGKTASSVFKAIESELIEQMRLYMYIDAGLEPDGSDRLRFEQHSFSFNTKDSFGHPIVLSGSVTFPSATNGVKTYLDNVTLYHSPLYNGKDSYPSVSSYSAMARALFNSLVVAPDIEGTGVSYGKTIPIHFDYKTMARQAADCELAALELVRKKGISIRPDYRTYNMGASRGGGVAFAFAKYMDTEASEAVRKAINLKDSYCVVPILGFEDLINYYGNNDDTGAKPFTIVNMLDSFYLDYQPSFGQYSLDDYYCDKYKDVRVLFKNKEYSLTEFTRLMEFDASDLDEVYSNNGIVYASDILSPDLYTNKGNIDRDGELYKALARVMNTIDPSIGWTPDTPVSICFSSGDDIIPFEDVANNVIERVKGPNLSYTQMSYLNHIPASFNGIYKMITQKDPAASGE